MSFEKSLEPVVASHGEIVKSPFNPPWWAKNRHVQTIFPRFLQLRASLTYSQERLVLPDGDFINLIWAGEVHTAKKLVVMFHGLEGSIKSHYTNDMAAHLVKQGYAVVLMHFRSCGGELNTQPRAYHSGETQDAWYFLNWLETKFPDIPKVAMGFSLGANMLLKLLSKHSDQTILRAAMVVSVPFYLEQCADAVNQGFSRVYQSYLLKSMVTNLLAKMRTIDYSNLLHVTPKQIRKFKSFKEFDQHVTAPLHGYTGADDYYKQCSSAYSLQNIVTPTLILHALDDPFMKTTIVPPEHALSPSIRIELSDKGGHVGFLKGTPWRPKIWMHARASAFLEQWFSTCSQIEGRR
jgi:predicted alpha/beta-fold hydrolase